MKYINVLLITFWFTLSLNAQSSYIVAGMYNSSDYYYDFNPDTLVISFDYPGIAFFNIDVDNDGLNDIQIKTRSNENGPLGCVSKYVEVIPENQAMIGLHRIDTTTTCPPPDSIVHVTKLLNYNDTIGSNLQFVDKKTYIDKILYGCVAPCSYNQSISDWSMFDTSDTLYIPFRIDSIYGWIRVQRYYSAGLRLLDFAFNYDSNNSNSTVQEDQMNIYPIPSTGVINIDLSAGYETDYLLQVFDFKGKEIIRHSLLDIRTQIYLPDKGIYIVKVTSRFTNYFRKIMIK